jgi:polyhydroxyalkanoate synthase
MGPRPFPLHLMLAMAGLMSSKSGLPNWNGGSSPLRSPPSWAPPESLAAELARFEPAAVARALDGAILAAADQFADGIAAYRAHPYRRESDDRRVVWREGSTLLLDHGVGEAGAEPGDAMPVLFAPSLINRGWVLDLIPGHGMLSWLAGRTIRPYRIEWGAPGEVERTFDVGDYVRMRLEPALDAVARLTGRAPVLVGYCMGGLLALAAAVRRPDSIAGLALLAAPWDFHAGGAARAQAIGAFHRFCRPFLGALDAYPIALIQALFATADPIVA